MTFNVAADLTKLDKDELYAIQANLERELSHSTLQDDARRIILVQYLERVDDEILTRASLA